MVEAAAAGEFMGRAYDKLKVALTEAQAEKQAEDDGQGAGAAAAQAVLPTPPPTPFYDSIAGRRRVMVPKPVFIFLEEHDLGVRQVLDTV